MKLSYISDLHLDKWIERGQTLKFLEELVQQTPLPGTDLVIAGDVSHDEIQFAEAMKFSVIGFERYFVFGNTNTFCFPKQEEIVSSWSVVAAEELMRAILMPFCSMRIADRDVDRLG